MGEIKRFLPWVAAVLLCWVAPVSAEYTLVLKNGRRITVQSYREEGGMIKFHGLGGEIGIGKDQIKTILKAGESEGRGLMVPSQQSSVPGAAPGTEPPPEAKPEPAGGVASDERKLAEERAKEEKEYQKKLRDVTEQLESAKQRYFTATQGGGTSSSATKEGYKALTADLMSRLKERRGAPDSEYEPQEKELRDLRLEIDKLQKERDTLIQEMKTKNFATGSP